MSYLPDYITWRGDLPFAADPANDLDTLVMAALSYIDLPAETQVFAQCAKSVPPDDPEDHFRGGGATQCPSSMTKSSSQP